MKEKIGFIFLIVNTVAVVVIAVLMVGGNNQPSALGAIGTRFPNGLAAGDATVTTSGGLYAGSVGLTATGPTNLNGTTTTGYSYDGFVLSNGLTIATGTVAALSFQNTNGDLSCQGGAMEFTHTGYVQSFQFAVSTSTTAFVGTEGNVIATTTVATTTSATTNWYNIATPSTWRFPKDAYLNAALYDNGHTGASSTAYANLSGKMRLSCWLNN